MDQTHAQSNFRFDANKEYAQDASVEIKPKQNFAPKDGQQSGYATDETFSTCAHKQTDLSTLLSQFFSTHFLQLFVLLSFFDTFFIELKT